VGAWLAAACFALLAGLFVGRPLFSSESVFFALEEPAQQLPFRAVLPGAHAHQPDGLSDQAFAFYPAYRFSARALAEGESLLWNPDLFAGVPWLANPQWGLCDPQVWVVLGLERSFGLEGFHFGLAWLAWLRLFAAGLGAYLLARRLGLKPVSAAFSGVSFLSSGALVSWVNFSVGHVIPFLPWILFAIEGCRTPSRALRSSALVALLFAGMIVGGHPETAFYGGLLASAWALFVYAREARAGWIALVGLALGSLLAAVSWIPFVEYLWHSGALLAHELARAPSAPRLAPVGIALAFLLCLVSQRGAAQPSHGRGAWGALVVLTSALLFVLARDASDALAVALSFDVLGAPGAGRAYSGSGAFGEAVSATLCSLTLVFALAGCASGTGKLTGRTFLMLCGLGAWLCTLSVPGFVDAWRHVPFFGQGAPARFGSIAALCLALLAGEALEHAAWRPRLSAVALLVALASAAFWPQPEVRVAPGLSASDELVSITERPTTNDPTRPLIGWVHSSVAADELHLRLCSADARFDLALRERAGVPSEEGGQATLEREWFEADWSEVGGLARGTWWLELELVRTSAGQRETLDTRVVAQFDVQPAYDWSAPGALLLGAALLVLLALPRGHAWRILGFVLLCGNAWYFGRGLNPATERERVLPPTETLEYLKEHAGLGRVLGGPGILAGNLPLAFGLRSASGYDALNVASFDGYRAYAQKPGSQPLLAWDALSMNLDHPAFRMLGVEWLVTREHLVHPQWECVAQPPETELYVQRARAPLPKAFGVGAVLAREELLARLDDDFDPRSAVFLERGADWHSSRPMTTARVDVTSFSNASVELDVELDGDGIVVVTEQAFPGWRAWVDDEPAPCLTVNSLFRGVPVDAGRHTLRLRYEPFSVRLGGALSLVALCAVLGAVAISLLGERPVKVVDERSGGDQLEQTGFDQDLSGPAR